MVGSRSIQDKGESESVEMSSQMLMTMKMTTKQVMTGIRLRPSAEERRKISGGGSRGDLRRRRRWWGWLTRGRVSAHSKHFMFMQWVGVGVGGGGTE